MRLPAGACSGSLWVSIQYEDLYGDPGLRRATAADTQSSSQEVLTMPAQDESRVSGDFNFYGPQYARFGSALAAELRREVYGEDLGQQGWRTATEQAEIAQLMGLASDSHVLDVACGTGGPSLALVERTGCRLTGLDLEAAAIAYAQTQAAARGLGDRATFVRLDCGASLPFADGSFDGVLCIDAISHLPDRFGTLSEWARLLRPGGRLVFTDPAVLTGAITKSELDIRAIGFFLVVPPGLDEAAIQAAGLAVMCCEDRTAAIARIAAGLHAARVGRAAELEREEGADWFGQRQRFLATAAELAESRRLSRFLFVGWKPAEPWTRVG
jgi:SAM-dependent methyltransferase